MLVPLALVERKALFWKTKCPWWDSVGNSECRFVDLISACEVEAIR